ncbi:hypothetical protein Tco_1411024 [Tanacetum coccineum]
MDITVVTLVEEKMSPWKDRIAIGTKTYRGSNSSDGGNTGDGVKTVCGVIGAGGEIGEITDGIILEFSEELKEMLPDEARK